MGGAREIDYFSLHSRKKRDVSVEMLDYAHVDRCEDVDELKGILALLRSGKEGRYPDLERATENRILALLPERERLKIERMRAEPSASEISTVKEDLESWTAEIDAKSRALQQKKPSKQPFIHPVRGQAAPQSTTKFVETIGMKEVSTTRATDDNQQEKSKPIPAYDFRSWEKYDVDQALAEIDQEEQKTRDAAEQQRLAHKQRADERKKELASLPDWLDIDEISPEVREIYALQEKQKGNECFKANETEEAILHYTRSIAFVDTDAILYSNRALAHLRHKSFALAEQDCTRAIMLDATYIKAWSRRGMVRFRRGKYAEAVEDFKEALRLDPGSNEIDKLLKKTQAKWEEVDGTIAASKNENNQETHNRSAVSSSDPKPLTRFEIIEEDDGEQETKRGDTRQESTPTASFTRFGVIEEVDSKVDDEQERPFTRFEIIESDEDDDE